MFSNNSPKLFNDWNEKISEWTTSEAGEKANKNLKSFAYAADSAVNTINERVAKLTSFPEGLVLAANDSGNIVLLHSISNLGGTMMKPDNKIVALSGLSHDAEAVIIDFDSAFKDYQVKAPKFEQIKECATKEELSNLHQLRNNSNSAHLSGIFMLAPFQANAILEFVKQEDKEELDPLELIEVVLAAGRKFDDEHAEDETYVEKGLDESSNLARYLWSVSKGLIEKTVIENNQNDEEVKTYLTKLRERHILPPVNDPRRFKRVEDQLGFLTSQGIQVSSAMSRVSEALEVSNELTSKRLQLTVSKMEKTKADKLHSSVINMLTNIASVDGIERPDGPADSIMAILECETHAKAELELVQQFKKKGIKVLFSPGLSKAFHDGKFLWGADEHPSNFSPFTIQLAQPDDQTMHDRHMYLSTFDTHGKSMTDDEIKKSLKQAIVVPESYHELVDQLEVYASAGEILCGDDGDMAFKIREFSKKVVKDNRSKIETLQKRDKKTCTYILFQLGLKCNNYLSKAESAHEPEDISRRLLDFSSLEDKITNLDLTPVLPPAFKQTAKREREEDEDEGESDEKEKKRTRRDREKKKANLVRNDKPVEDWLLKDGEKMAAFGGANAEGRPKWNDSCLMCHKWFIKGVCFDDCTNKASHVGRDKVPTEKKGAFAAWRASKGSN